MDFLSGGGLIAPETALWTMASVVALVAFVAVAAFAYGFSTPSRAARKDLYAPGPVDPHSCAIVIATRNGVATLDTTIRAALANQVPVYVLSDGSNDETVAVARAAGADVVDYPVNRGKPATLHAGCRDLDLLDRYEFLTIIDDDTQLEPDFVQRSLEYFDAETAIVVGRTCTLWPRNLRWNPFVAYRAFAYWMYQLTVRHPQSWVNAMNCISGSNSTYRTSVLREVLVEETPYIVDDTYWVLETHRLGLGRIRYGSKAWAWIQDPTNLKDFYRQNLRWLWGTNQGIVGHRIGRRLVTGRPSVFETLYSILIVQWALYLLGLPVLVFIGFSVGPVALLLIVATRWLVFYVLLVVASVRLRQPRLLLFAPAIIVLDLLYRAIWLHAIVKTIRQPRVTACVWDSPARVAA